METDVLLSLLQRGGWVMYPLLSCSLTVVWVVIDRILYWRGQAGDTANDPERVLQLVREGDHDGALKLASSSRSASARVLAAGVQPDHDAVPLDERLTLAGLDERRRVMSLLGVLDIIVTAAPLLGILGTVLGIIDAFEVMESRGMADTRAITGGVGRALVTTASGLVIALTALFAHHGLGARSDRAMQDIQRHGTVLEAILARGER